MQYFSYEKLENPSFSFSVNITDTPIQRSNSLGGVIFHAFAIVESRSTRSLSILYAVYETDMYFYYIRSIFLQKQFSLSMCIDQYIW